MDIEQRVKRLEQEDRQLKLPSSIVLAILLVVGLTISVGVAGAAPGPDGEKFFSAQVLPALEANGCTGCHLPAVGYVGPAVTYAELLPFLAMGQASDNNVLVQKMANLRSFGPDRPAHIGGQRCASLAVEPCKSLMEWWEVEFGASAAEVVGIIDVAMTAPKNVATYPVEDSSVWRVVSGGAPQAAERVDFVSPDSAFYVGYSQYETMTLEIATWPLDEFMFFIEGEVEITDGSGLSRTYGPGDMLVMPRGFTGTWKQRGPIKKIAVAYSPEQ